MNRAGEHQLPGSWRDVQALDILHPLTVLVWSVHMIVRNVLGHAGFELMPAGLARSRWLGWLTTATHHDLHHATFQ